MGLLDFLRSSPEQKEARATYRAGEATRIWDEYTQTMPRKKELISKITDQAAMAELRELLKHEIAEVSQEEILSEQQLSFLGDEATVLLQQRLFKMQVCLYHVVTRYEYVFSLLMDLYQALVAQQNFLEKLIAKPDDAESLRDFRNAYQHELDVNEKINEIRTFTTILDHLATEEKIIRKLTHDEGKLLVRLEAAAAKQPEEVMENTMLRKMTEALRKAFIAVAEYDFEGHGIEDPMAYEAPYEFAFRPQFESFARPVLENARGKPISERLLQTFVQEFRGWLAGTI